jgi:hypothetical protein
MHAKQSYAELHQRLKDRTSLDLLGLLDERSTKIGDTALDLLSTREERAIVLNAILSDRLKTRNGKVRALNFLNQRGRRMPEALKGYLHLIHDKNPDVVSAALFGLVFWNESCNLEAIQSIRNPHAQEHVNQALAALRAKDPTIYSPHYFDQAGVWNLQAAKNVE